MSDEIDTLRAQVKALTERVSVLEARGVAPMTRDEAARLSPIVRSLMDCTEPQPGYQRVRCPGCGAVELVALANPEPTLLHVDAECWVLGRIRAALDEFLCAPGIHA